MTIFVDESGIHKDIDHSAFSLVYLATEGREEVEKTIVEIEQHCRVQTFHWTESPWKIREQFLHEAIQLPFTVKIAIFQNPIRPAEALEHSLQHLLIEKRFDALIIDGKKPRWIERRIKKVLRDKGISVKNLRTVRRDSSPGVRLADAFAGLSRAYYDNPEGKAKILWSFAKKKITTQLLGGQENE